MRKPLHNRISVSPYIAPEGQRQLSEELLYLWKAKRSQVTQAVVEGYEVVVKRPNGTAVLVVTFVLY